MDLDSLLEKIDRLETKMSELAHDLSKLARDIEVKHSENSGRLDNLSYKLTHFDKCLDELKSELFGGEGRKGVIKELTEKLQQNRDTILIWTGGLGALLGAVGIILTIVTIFWRK